MGRRRGIGWLLARALALLVLVDRAYAVDPPRAVSEPFSTAQIFGATKSCSGCCSHHGGITSACGFDGHVICVDGTTSPTCLCSSCGISSPPAGTCYYSYSDWSPCQPNGLQTRTVLPSVIPPYPGCTGSPILTRSCVYSAPASNSNYTALWWNPAESGWGMNVNHQGSILFVTLFTYDEFGAPMWLLGSDVAAQAGGNSFSGALYQVAGPPFDASPWTPVTPAQVGTISVSFTSDNAATVTYNVGTTTVSKSVQKQDFGPMPVCTAMTGSRSFIRNYQDLWWNPQESGWGINLTHEGDVIFATLFTYNRSGHEVWLVASDLAKQSDGSYQGPLYTATGPAYDAQPWNAAAVRATQVGTMTLRFSSGELGTLSYTYNGTMITKTIQRQVFGTTVPLCQ